MKRRKKKGSSLLMVIAIFGILTILGTSILGVVTANYKLRKEENERIKNLYGAESGIDEAYVVMCKVIDDAIAHGAKEADGLKSTKTLKVDAKSGEEKEEKLEVSLKDRNDKFKKEFVKYLTEKENGLESEVSRTYEINGSKAEIKGELESKAELEDKNFTITSTFEDENKKNRTVKVTYKIKIPQSYKDRFTVDGELSPIINYSMAADGDLRVKGSKDAIIKDDIWIKGNSESNRTVANKYKGGIEIENSSVKFEGNIYTASNISIGKMGNAQVLHDSESRNVYAENILLGNTVNMDSKMGSVFSGEKANLYLANDLVVGCGDAKLEVDNLYAFNDRNVDVLGKEVRSSSSIIINSMTWPKDQAKLSVNSNAYVMGVAYINTDNRAYQTGESVAYKGNYKAYSIPIIDKDYSSNQFEYISPLMLITKDSKGNNLTLEDKAEHFKAYSDEFKLRTEGISLPSNTYAAGAYVNSKGKVLNDKKATNQLLEQKKAFVKEVYNMGIDGNYKEDDFYYGSAKKTVENQINWKGVDI